MTAVIYHVASVAEWQAAVPTGEYRVSSRGCTLEDEGFLHASFANQLPGVLERFYADHPGPLCLLEVDEDAAGDALVVEDLSGSGEAFPHLYAPLQVGWVVRVLPLYRDGGDGLPGGGPWALPPEFGR